MGREPGEWTGSLPFARETDAVSVDLGDVIAVGRGDERELPAKGRIAAGQRFEAVDT